MLPKNKFELLDFSKINAVIHPKNREYISHLEIFPSLESTNTYLLNQISEQAPSGWVCLAEQQTAGRGRLGKTWYSPPGANIYLSLLWRFQKDMSVLSGLSMSVGKMVLSALEKYGVSSELTLKFPNDIVWQDRKLAGILIECRGSVAVIGIGINVELPEDADPHWVSISEIVKAEFRRNELVGLVLDELISGIVARQ